MRCSWCGSWNTTVKESRPLPDRRRRRRLRWDCGKRFTTSERVVPEAPVEKRTEENDEERRRGMAGLRPGRSVDSEHPEETGLKVMRMLNRIKEDEA